MAFLVGKGLRKYVKREKRNNRWKWKSVIHSLITKSILILKVTYNHVTTSLSILSRFHRGWELLLSVTYASVSFQNFWCYMPSILFQWPWISQHCLFSNSIINCHYYFIYYFYSDAIRKLSWSGIPVTVRPTTWQLLCVSYRILHYKFCSRLSNRLFLICKNGNLIEQSFKVFFEITTRVIFLQTSTEDKQHWIESEKSTTIL